MMRQIFLTNAQFGYVHLYACSLHGLPTATTETCDSEAKQAVRFERQLSKASLGFLQRLAERVALIFFADKTPAKNV